MLEAARASKQAGSRWKGSEVAPPDRTADVIVIGGGIHGCSAALHLVLSGLSVIVIEKDYVGRHASGVNAGGVRRLGPDLSEIGSKLSRQAMFESIIYPSAGISHNYEAYTLVLVSGTTVNGLITSETDDSISIKGDDAIIRTFKMDEVEEKVKQKISLMPADLQKLMSVQELTDVVDYLMTLKKK